MQGGPTSESEPEATLVAQAAVKMINTVLGGVHGDPVQLSTCFIQDSDCPGDNLRRAVHQQQGHQGHRRRHQSIGNAAMCSVLNGPIPVVLGVSASPADDTAKNVFEYSRRRHAATSSWP